MLKRLSKKSIKIACILVLGLTVFLLLIGSVTEWIIEKYDEEWTGRRIELDGINVNLFTGEFNVHDFTLFEINKKDTFVHWSKAYINISIYKLISGNYEITEASVVKPTIFIEQGNKGFNFDDLLAHFSENDTTHTTTDDNESTRYKIENIHIDTGWVRYKDLTVSSEFIVKEFNASCPLITWNNNLHHYEFKGVSGTGGALQASLDLNLESLDYSLICAIKDLNLFPLGPYLKETIHVNAFEGEMSTQFTIKGTFEMPEKIALSGLYELKKMMITDPKKDTLLGVNSFIVGIDSINTGENIYDLGPVTMVRPLIKFELYPDGDNFSRLLVEADSIVQLTGDSTSTIEGEVDYTNPFKLLAYYIDEIAKNYVLQDYNVDTVNVTQGILTYNDFTLDEKFELNLTHFSISSGKLDSENSNLNFTIASTVNHTGKMTGKLNVDSHELSNIELLYRLEDVRISSFSPYSTYYVAHPFWDGLIAYDNETKIINHVIDSKNKLIIEKIEVGKKVKNQTAFNLPVRLAIAILKDPEGNVTLEVPVVGDLNDPNYKVGKVIWDIIKNLLVKAATAPFKLLSSAVGANEEDLKSIKFEYLSDSLSSKQQKNLDFLARVLKLKPDLKIEMEYLHAASNEKEMYAAFEAKKRYILKLDSADNKIPSKEQLIQIESLSINDSSFVNYLNDKILFEAGLTNLEKCRRLIGPRRIDRHFQELMQTRRKNIKDYLLIKKELPESAFTFTDGSGKNSDGLPMFEVKIGLRDE